MNKKIVFLVILALTVLLTGCHSTATNYVQKKIDQREQDRETKEKYSSETKGSSVWWNSRYDNRTSNRHLSDQFGTR